MSVALQPRAGQAARDRSARGDGTPVPEGIVSSMKTARLKRGSSVRRSSVAKVSPATKRAARRLDHRSARPGSRTAVEICAGAGGQALGVERAGFRHLALVEIDPHACSTLRENFGKRGLVFEGDVRGFLEAVRLDKSQYADLDLLAGGVPCPPFSLAGKQLGQDDDRDLFPVMLDLVEELMPKAVLIENVRGLLQAKFAPYRERICSELRRLGYTPMEWSLFNASDFGVPQLRPRSILVALRSEYSAYYTPPAADPHPAPTVGDVLKSSMVQRGMKPRDAKTWAAKADRIAPTLVGGSRKHGGADLGPTRAKRHWEEMGVDAHGVANDDDEADLVGPNGRGPRLTVSQAALLQGFPPDWIFHGGKTARYRQVGNAFPPPVAFAVAQRIKDALHQRATSTISPKLPPKGAAMRTVVEQPLLWGGVQTVRVKTRRPAAQSGRLAG